MLNNNKLVGKLSSRNIVGRVLTKLLGLDFVWDGTRLGVKKENDTEYEYADLIGPQGPQGERGLQGQKGDTGNGLEFKWQGTQLGVRVAGTSEYTYVDLKGQKGDNATVIDNLNSTSTTDALSAKQGKALGTYSFDETVIGYGPNGEKMYRKIITSTGISGSEVQVWHGITNLKQVFMKDASATYNGVTYFNPLTFKDINDRFVKLHIGNSNWMVYITLVYTKTVD